MGDQQEIIKSSADSTVEAAPIVSKHVLNKRATKNSEFEIPCKLSACIVNTYVK